MAFLSDLRDFQENAKNFLEECEKIGSSVTKILNNQKLENELKNQSTYQDPQKTGQESKVEKM